MCTVACLWERQAGRRATPVLENRRARRLLPAVAIGCQAMTASGPSSILRQDSHLRTGDAHPLGRGAQADKLPDLASMPRTALSGRRWRLRRHPRRWPARSQADVGFTFRAPSGRRWLRLPLWPKFRAGRATRVPAMTAQTSAAAMRQLPTTRRLPCLSRLSSGQATHLGRRLALPVRLLAALEEPHRAGGCRLDPVLREQHGEQVATLGALQRPRRQRLVGQPLQTQSLLRSVLLVPRVVPRASPPQRGVATSLRLQQPRAACSSLLLFVGCWLQPGARWLPRLQLLKLYRPCQVLASEYSSSTTTPPSGSRRFACCADWARRCRR